MRARMAHPQMALIAGGTAGGRFRCLCMETLITSKVETLRRMAATMLANADDCNMPFYRQKMLYAALELEAEADHIEEERRAQPRLRNLI